MFGRISSACVIYVGHDNYIGEMENELPSGWGEIGSVCIVE